MFKKEFILYLTVIVIGALFVSEAYAFPPNKVWEKRYNAPLNMMDSAIAVSVNSNQNVFVTGWSCCFFYKS